MTDHRRRKSISGFLRNIDRTRDEEVKGCSHKRVRALIIVLDEYSDCII
jgi:hypothetical protein